MKKASVTPMKAHIHKQPIEGMRLGKIVEIDQDGHVWVDFPGAVTVPCQARFINTVSRAVLDAIVSENKDVMLTFDNSDPALPIIIGSVHTNIDELPKSQPPLALDVDSSGKVTLNGRQVDIKADEQMVFHCGKASITLTRAGKMLIRGAYLSNYSTGVNQIKGGSVRIN